MNERHIQTLLNNLKTGKSCQVLSTPIYYSFGIPRPFDVGNIPMLGAVEVISVNIEHMEVTVRILGIESDNITTIRYFVI